MSNKMSLNYIIARLRLSVLAVGETLPGKYWDSKGLSISGQSDLSMVFPRSSLLAAVSHATELARTHHDKQTRSHEVHHLFRLPTEIESTIHHELLSSIPKGFSIEKDLWHEMNDLPSVNTSPEEGAVNLGTLDLSKAKSIAKLAGTYKASMDANLNCIPYFKLIS